MSVATAVGSKFYKVPAGTKMSHCNGAARGGVCSAPMYWINNPDTGTRLPIDCEVDGGKRPSEAKETGQFDLLSAGVAPVFDGKGVSHFETCPDRDLFRTRGDR